MDENLEEAKKLVRHIIAKLEEARDILGLNSFEGEYQWVGKQYIQLQRFLDDELEVSEIQEALDGLADLVKMMRQLDNIQKL